MTQDRLSAREGHLYDAVRLYVNFFQPSLKLAEKTRRNQARKYRLVSCTLSFRPGRNSRSDAG